MADDLRALQIVADREAAALEALLADCRDLIAEDPDIVLDLAEGETNALELIDALLLADGFDADLIKGAKEAKAVIDARIRRFEGRVERRRAIIERFMLILDQPKLERPAATASLARRKISVEVADESAVPAEFFKTEVVLDKKKLNERVAAILAAREAEFAKAKAENRDPDVEPLPEGVVLGSGGFSLTVRRR